MAAFLAGTESAAAASYNLTALGTADWAPWGLAGSGSNFDHDASGGSQISNVTEVGSGNYGGWTYSPRNVSWTNGTPTASDSGDDGYIWANNAIGAGYSFTVPASTTSRTLYVYLGGASSGGTLDAHLSDGSAADYTVTVSGTANYQDLVAITYAAASAGQTLTITYDKTQTIGAASGSVDLMAAWLTRVTPVAPTITTNPTSQSVTACTPVSFTAAATGTPTPTVQWELSTNTGSVSPPSPALPAPPSASALPPSAKPATNTKRSSPTPPGPPPPLPHAYGDVPRRRSLAGTASTAASSYNLTALGTADWGSLGPRRQRQQLRPQRLRRIADQQCHRARLRLLRRLDLFPPQCVLDQRHAHRLRLRR